MEATDTSVRAAFVGLGTIGRIHATRVADLGHDVVAGVDIDPEARTAFANDYGAEPYAELTEMLEGSAPDAVFVTTPNRYHEDAAITALERGHDVLVEKPLAHTLESAERIAAAARAAEGSCMVGFTMRFSGATDALRSYWDEATFDQLSHVQANYIRQDNLPGGGRGWFTEREIAGGGVLIDIGVHSLDLALHVLGYPSIEEVMGETRTEFGPYDVDDSVTALIRCEGGRTITLEASWMANREPDNSLVVRGPDAGAQLDVTEPAATVIRQGSEDGTPNRVDLPTDDADMHTREVQVFLEAVAANEPPNSCTVDEALTVQRAIDAIYRSSERGRAISFD